MANDVFIAYSRKDSAAAETVELRLLQSGLTCYRDVTNIPGSAEWMAEITKAIEACHTIVVLFSHQSVKSNHVKREVAIAVESGKPLVPLFLSHDIELPPNMQFAVAGYHKIMVFPI